MMPRYTLRQLVYFVGAAETGTISGAAERFFITQSAMSAALADLENAVGAQLFVRRRGRGLELTPSGRAFLPQVRRLLQDADDLGSLAGALQDSLTGRLAVGCFNAMAPAVLTPLVVEFAAAHPDVRLDIHADAQDVLMASLVSGELELALIYDFELLDELVFDEVAASVAHVLLPVDHPLATQQDVRLDDLDDTPLIAVATPPARSLTQTFRLSGVHVSPQLELANFDLIRALVQAGRGYTILSQPLGGTPPHWGSGVVAVPIADPLPPLTIVLARRRGIRLTRRAQAFRELCVSRGQDLLSHRTDVRRRR